VLWGLFFSGTAEGGIEKIRPGNNFFKGAKAARKALYVPKAFGMEVQAAIRKVLRKPIKNFLLLF
jgi:hypothetical protein